MCDRDVKGVPSIFKVIRSDSALARMLPTLDLSCDDAARRVTRGRGDMSNYNYDAQKTGKGFKMNAHHVVLRQMNHRYEQCRHGNRCKRAPK